VFQFVGQMAVTGPEHVRTEYAGYLEKALDDVLGEFFPRITTRKKRMALFLLLIV